MNDKLVNLVYNPIGTAVTVDVELMPPFLKKADLPPVPTGVTPYRIKTVKNIIEVNIIMGNLILKHDNGTTTCWADQTWAGFVTKN